MLAALLLVQSTEGNVASSSPSPPRSCADSATLEYPAGTGATAASTVAPYEEIGGTAGLTFAAWVYRESTTPHTDSLYSACDQTVRFGVQTSIYTKEPPSQTYTLDPDYGLNFICSEASRLAAPCGLCGPNWGDLAACQAECDDTVGCTAITWFTDNGCRLYSACSAADPNPFGVLTSIYIRDV
jgi:hypothetical protein